MTLETKDVRDVVARGATRARAGLEALLERSLLDSIWQRRTHRVSRGTSLEAGTMSYASAQEPAPLSEIEQAVLITLLGCTGLTMPDRPFSDPKTGAPLMAKPNLGMAGRSAGSPDNAQGTHFFMIDDTGTYFLRKLEPPPAGTPFNAEAMIERARQCKILVRAKRLDVPDGNRDFPAYLDSNRYLSNLPGTTIFLPVVDLSRQYINGTMYLLTEPDGARPTLVDDRNFYQVAGVKSWVKRGFLNGSIKIPLGMVGTLRTQIEADLLLQNLMLVANAMGLGAWIHASITPSALLGDPSFSGTYGPMLGFEFVTPRWQPLDALRWQIPLPSLAKLRAHPVGLKVNGEYVIKGMCPPYYPSMSAAVDAVVETKFGPNGVYTDRATFEKTYKGDYGDRFLKEAAVYSEEIIDCARDICTYIYETHGRFPAHCDAIYAPGVWLQVHHVELEYYQRFFRAGGLTEAHLRHDERWHG